MPSGRTVQQKRQASIREALRWEGWKNSCGRWAAWCWEGGPRLPYLGKAPLVRLPLRRPLAPFCSLLFSILIHIRLPSSSSTSPPPFLSLFFFIIWPIRIPSFLWDPLHSFGCTSLTFTFTIRFRHSLLRPTHLFRIFTQQIRLTYPSFSCQIQRSIYTTLSPTSDSSDFYRFHTFVDPRLHSRICETHTL